MSVNFKADIVRLYKGKAPFFQEGQVRTWAERYTGEHFTHFKGNTMNGLASASQAMVAQSAVVPWRSAKEFSLGLPHVAVHPRK